MNSISSASLSSSHVDEPVAFADDMALVEAMAPLVLESAEAAGAPICYVGVAPLFSEIRLYRGPESDWVLSRLDDDPTAEDGIVIPRGELDRLECLVANGLDFPEVYVAHEVPKPASRSLSDPASAVASLPPSQAGRGSAIAGSFHSLTPEAARALVPAPPAPQETVQLSASLGRRADGTLKAVAGGLAAVGIGAGALAAAPVLIAGALLSGVDPILFGAVTADLRPGEGKPAAWFALAQWDW